MPYIRMEQHLEMTNVSVMTIKNFLKFTGQKEILELEFEELRLFLIEKKRLIDLYVEKNKIVRTTEMNVANTYPIPLLAKMLLKPWDNVIVTTMSTYKKTDAGEETYRDGINVLSGDVAGEGLVLSIRGDQYAITLVHGYNIYTDTHTLKKSRGVDGMSSLLHYHPKKKLTHRIRMAELRKLFNELHTGKIKTETDITDMEEWILNQNIHKATVSLTIDSDNKLFIGIRQKFDSTNSESFDWEVDDFMNVLRQFHATKREVKL